MGTRNLLVGTTSWTDKTLVDSGLFYPGAAKTSEARLRAVVILEALGYSCNAQPAELRRNSRLIHLRHVSVRRSAGAKAAP